MQLPLFVQTPNVALTESSIVRIPAGDWVVETDNNDSILNLSIHHSDGPASLYEDVKNGFKFSVQRSSPAWVMIVKAGSAKTITLFINDNLTPDTKE